MQFLATATNVTDVTVSTKEYKYVRDVGCPTCGKVFRLWAPFLETEASEVQAQTDWLSKRLLRDCPEHVVYVNELLQNTPPHIQTIVLVCFLSQDFFFHCHSV